MFAGGLITPAAGGVFAVVLAGACELALPEPTRTDPSSTAVVGPVIRASAREEIDPETELDALREARFWIVDDLYERALEIDPA